MNPTRELAEVEDCTPSQGIALQERARHLVRQIPPVVAPRTVAGVDVSVRGKWAAAAIVVFELPGLAESARATALRPVRFPYVPGLLAFREVPVVLAAFATLPVRPDLLMIDGHGLAHPRRFGLACHLGLALDLPAIGVGKTRFVGDHREPGARRGCRTRLVDRGEVIGTVLRTREGVRPVFVSVGHRLDLATATLLVLACTQRFRLPEPIRAADRLAGQVTSQAVGAASRRARRS